MLCLFPSPPSLLSLSFPPNFGKFKIHWVPFSATCMGMGVGPSEAWVASQGIIPEEKQTLSPVPPAENSFPARDGAT